MDAGRIEADATRNCFSGWYGSKFARQSHGPAPAGTICQNGQNRSGQRWSKQLLTELGKSSGRADSADGALPPTALDPKVAQPAAWPVLSNGMGSLRLDSGCRTEQSSESGICFSAKPVESTELADARIRTKEIFLEMLTTAIVRKRNPAELTALLTMLDDTRKRLGLAGKSGAYGLSIQGNNRKAETRSN